MQLNTVIDDNLMLQAKQVSGLQTEREIIETALRLWLKTQQIKSQASDTEAAFAGFIGCAHGDPLLSEQYKERLSDHLRDKHADR